MLKLAVLKLIEKENLCQEEMAGAMREIMDGRASLPLIGSFLTALRLKGETIEEITAGARVMREKAEKVDLKDRYTLDTCGTGGDQSGTYNISTAAAFICGAAGIPVAKHGNRSVSSKSGSADVLEALGANITLSPQQVEQCVREQNIGFFFAPVFHRAMKHVAQPRKELGFRTIFNILGPLTNPSHAKAQILGVFDKELTEIMAEVLKNLGTEHALVVHGRDGLDEISSCEATKVTELKDGCIRTYHITPENFGFIKSRREEILGGDAVENAKIIRGLFEGAEGPKRDILLLNSGAALYVGGKANSIEEGIKLAVEIIDTGAAKQKLEDYIEYTVRFA